MSASKATPPPGLTTAELRQWKIRQKVLARGEGGVEKIMSTRDLQREASKKEMETFDKDTKPEPSEEGTEEKNKVVKEKDELPKWERKWKEQAEKAAVVELDFEKSTAKEKEGSAEMKKNDDEGIRQRKGAEKSEKSEKRKDSDLAEQKGEDKNEKTEATESVTKLKEKLRVNKWLQQEYIIRQASLIIFALIGAFLFATKGGIVSPENMLESTKNFVSDNQNENDNEWTDFDDEKENNNLEIKFQDNVLSMIDPPMNGWLSIPICIIMIRLFVHLSCSTIGQYNFSMISTKNPTNSPNQEKAPFPFSLISTFMAMNPALSSISNSYGLIQSVLADTVIFLVIFILTTAILVEMN